MFDFSTLFTVVRENRALTNELRTPPVRPTSTPFMASRANFEGFTGPGGIPGIEAGGAGVSQLKQSWMHKNGHESIFGRYMGVRICFVWYEV